MTTINFERAAPHVQQISQQGQQLVAALSEQINAVSIMRAMQVGYLMCCEDNDLQTPVFEDPTVELGMVQT